MSNKNEKQSINKNKITNNKCLLEQDWQIDIVDNQAILTKYIGPKDALLVLPSGEYQGYPITYDPNCFKDFSPEVIIINASFLKNVKFEGFKTGLNFEFDNGITEFPSDLLPSNGINKLLLPASFKNVCMKSDKITVNKIIYKGDRHDLYNFEIENFVNTLISNVPDFAFYGPYDTFLLF